MNYRGITLIAAKVYNTLLLKYIWFEIKKIFRKIRMALEKLIHNITDSFNPLNHQRSTWKKSWGNTLIHICLQGIWFHVQKEDGANTMISYHHNDVALLKMQKSMVHSPNGDTNSFDIVAGVFQEDSIALSMFIILIRLRNTNINRSNKRK